MYGTCSFRYDGTTRSTHSTRLHLVTTDLLATDGCGVLVLMFIASGLPGIMEVITYEAYPHHVDLVTAMIASRLTGARLVISLHVGTSKAGSDEIGNSNPEHRWDGLLNP